MELVQNTMKSFVSIDNKILTRFSVRTKSGNVLKLCIMLLPKDRYEDFIDLYMKYFVPYEIIHIGTGILESNEALNEYKTLLSVYLNNESVHKVICCLDSDGTPLEILGGFVLKLHRKGGHIEDVIEVQTDPMKKFKKIDKVLDYLVPIADLMKKYNADQYYEIMYAFVRPDMRQMGVLKKLVESSFLMCRINDVPLMGTWSTSVVSQKAAQNIGYELEYEISFKDFGQLVDVNFEDDAPTIKFMAQRIFKISNL